MQAIHRKRINEKNCNIPYVFTACRLVYIYNNVCKFLPSPRQCYLFSATVAETVRTPVQTGTGDRQSVHVLHFTFHIARRERGGGEGRRRGEIRGGGGGGGPLDFNLVWRNIFCKFKYFKI